MEYATRKREGLIILPETLGTGNICVATQLDNHALINQVNSFIDQYRADGTYDDMYHRWVHSEHPQMPNIPVPETPDGELVVGSNTENEPMGFVSEGGKATGFDIEFARRLALALNKRLELKIMDYDALFPAAASGKVDLSIAQLDATPERAESMLFSKPYIDSPVALMVRQENYPGAADSATTGRVQE